MRTRPRPSDPRSDAGADPVVLARFTVVESEACHFCDDARQVLRQVAARYPIEVRTIDVRSPEGERLMRAHRAAMSPLVLLDGAFFSNGRLPRRKLAKVLGQRPTEPTTAGATVQDAVRHG